MRVIKANIFDAKFSFDLPRIKIEMRAEEYRIEIVYCPDKKHPVQSLLIALKEIEEVVCIECLPKELRFSPDTLVASGLFFEYKNRDCWTKSTLEMLLDQVCAVWEIGAKLEEYYLSYVTLERAQMRGVTSE